MEKDKNIQEELKDLAPRLSKLPKQLHEGVPYNYFESLPNKILSQVRDEEQTDSVWQKWLANIWQPKLVPIYVTACVIAFGVFWLTNQSTSTFNFDAEMSELNAEDVDQYILANISDFDINIVETSYYSMETDDLMFLDSEDDEIEEYLLDEMTDLEYDGIVL